jgi:pSer/pThr/pTyr-binding forkhead associated (FHA) protein
MFELNYTSGSQGTVRFRIDRPETTIGRSEKCGLVIPSDTVSREHARIHLDGDALTIEDLKSSNGTFVNGQPADKRTALKAGDVIALGSETIIVQKVTPYSPKLTRADTPVAKHQLEQPDTAQFQITPIVEHAERLVANAASMTDPRVATAELRRTIDAVAMELARSTDRAKKIRLLAVTEIVVSWHPDGSQDAWRTSIAKRMGFEP